LVIGKSLFPAWIFIGQRCPGKPDFYGLPIKKIVSVKQTDPIEKSAHNR
jgi:hypothetical protein